jgi:hypothetical protein
MPLPRIDSFGEVLQRPFTARGSVCRGVTQFLALALDVIASFSHFVLYVVPSLCPGFRRQEHSDSSAEAEAPKKK